MGQAASRDTKTEGLREWGRRYLSRTEDRSWLADRSSESTDQGGGIKGRNRSPHRMRAKSDTKAPIKRPKPLVLAPSNKDSESPLSSTCDITTDVNFGPQILFVHIMVQRIQDFPFQLPNRHYHIPLVAQGTDSEHEQFHTPLSEEAQEQRHHCIPRLLLETGMGPVEEWPSRDL